MNFCAVGRDIGPADIVCRMLAGEATQIFIQCINAAGKVAPIMRRGQRLNVSGVNGGQGLPRCQTRWRSMAAESFGLGLSVLSNALAKAFQSREVSVIVFDSASICFVWSCDVADMSNSSANNLVVIFFLQRTRPCFVPGFWQTTIGQMDGKISQTFQKDEVVHRAFLKIAKVGRVPANNCTW